MAGMYQYKQHNRGESKMGKVKKMEEKVETKLSNQEIIESLKIQLEQYRTMAIKAEGAIEVLIKMEEENSKED